MIQFNVIFFIIIIACTSLFTALQQRNTTTEHYDSFFLSIRTLYSSALGIFNLEIFEEYRHIGEMLLCAFLVISYVLMLHLLIGILTHVYERQKLRVDSEYRAVLITFYEKWHWDD